MEPGEIWPWMLLLNTLFKKRKNGTIYWPRYHSLAQLLKKWGSVYHHHPCPHPHPPKNLMILENWMVWRWHEFILGELQYRNLPSRWQFFGNWGKSGYFCNLPMLLLSLENILLAYSPNFVWILVLYKTLSLGYRQIELWQANGHISNLHRCQDLDFRVYE